MLGVHGGPIKSPFPAVKVGVAGGAVCCTSIASSVAKFATGVAFFAFAQSNAALHPKGKNTSLDG